MRMRALRPQSFSAGGRSKNRGIHHVAIEDFVPREIEVNRARHEDIAFAALTQAITQRPQLRVGDLEDDAPALRTAKALFLKRSEERRVGKERRSRWSP